LGTRDLGEKVFSENLRVHKLEASHYEQIHHEIFNRTEQARLKQSLAKHLGKPKGMRVLDYGCGTGNLTKALAHLGAIVTAADISPEMIDIAQSNLRKEIQVGQVQTYLLGGDLSTLGMFDCVVMYSVLHHLYDPIGALSILATHVSPTGTILIEHEANPGFFDLSSAYFYKVYMLTCNPLNKLWEWGVKIMRGISTPELRISYAWSDYGAQEKTRIPWPSLALAMQRLGFRMEADQYLLSRTRVPNPIYLLCKRFLADTMSVAFKRTDQTSS
jgi:ubiquinone/menaquinone biosynthesis C-methylase UbiE